MKSHPEPDSIVVSSAKLKVGHPASTAATPDGESKKLDAWARKFDSSASITYITANAAAHAARYDHHLWKEFLSAAEFLLQDKQAQLTSMAQNGLLTSKNMIRASTDVADASSKSMASVVALRRQAWLRLTQFKTELQRDIIDLPFNVMHLSGDKV